MTNKIIYKICNEKEWTKALEKGIYEGSEHDIRDGFIHLSTKSQLEGTLSKHFSNQENLLLIAIEEEKISSNLKYEPARNGELFPHIYGKLETHSVLWVKEIKKQSDGCHLLPENI